MTRPTGRKRAALLLLLAGCARKPLVEATTPVPVGCGEMPEPPVLCQETAPATMTAAEDYACWVQSATDAVAYAAALRAQFKPCAIPAKAGKAP